MPDKSKSFALSVSESLDKIAPKGTRFVVLYILPDDEEHFGMASNMSDDGALYLLADAAASLASSSAEVTVEEKDEKASLN